MIFVFDYDRLNAFLKRLLQKDLKPEAWQWLENEGESIRNKRDIPRFNIAFVAMPRKTGKALINLSAGEESVLSGLRPDFTVNGWAVDRLARVWLLLQVNPEPKEKYMAVIENLFLSAEMSELVALYSSLPVLAYPELWTKRCAEGIRSNIGQVLEAIICNNPYPAEQLDEAAWNQLVLKAIFTDKPILAITGLKKRMNGSLAQSLSDYAHERWAASREVNPLLWICVGPFINEKNFSDIERLFSSGNEVEREAAALTCYESTYEPARQLLEQNRALKSNIENGTVSWDGIAQAISRAQPEIR